MPGQRGGQQLLATEAAGAHCLGHGPGVEALIVGGRQAAAGCVGKTAQQANAHADCAGLEHAAP
ncbi:hypothetical protein D9M71_636110 [compost metagenome]